MLIQKVKQITVGILIAIHILVFGGSLILGYQKFSGGWDITWYDVFNPMLFLILAELFIAMAFGFSVLIIGAVITLFDWAEDSYNTHVQEVISRRR